MTPKRTTITPAWKPLDAAQSTLGLGVTATCYHTGNKVVWATKSGATLAGASGHGFRCDHADLLIDAAGIAIKEVGESANCLSGDPDLVNKLQKYVQPAPKALRIEWTDYSIPRLRASFWSALLSTFKSGQRVVCACAAGHGRTGTALACLVVADMVARNGEADAAQAIRVVRDAHCERAVEAKSQARYVAAVAAWLMAGEKGDAAYQAEVERQFKLVESIKEPERHETVLYSSGKKEERVEDERDVDVVFDSDVEIDQEDVEFLSDSGEVINADGEVVYTKQEIEDDPELRDYAASLPTWNEYIAWRSELIEEKSTQDNQQEEVK